MSHTVKKIAELAGVSPATVSRVVNGTGSVAPEKRERVLSVLEELNGRRPAPRSGARMMNIGALLPADPRSDAHAILQKLSYLAEQMPRRWNLQLLPPGILPMELEARYLRGELAGLLLIGHTADSPELSGTLKRIAHIWLNSHRSSDADQTILMGNEFAGRIAARYLQDSGCSRCAVLSAPSRNPGFPGRVSGFRFELFSAGSPCETVGITLPRGCKGFEEAPDGELESALERVLPAIGAGCFDGLFSPEERMTALLCRVFARHGVAAPPRLVSCNHTPEYFAGLYPRPASIDLGPRMLAELALKELMRRISGEAPRADHVAVIVTPQLIPGD
ncbi:MAG: LacI family DNA-binding transcriptional regulator [Lentisphaeria bacterium]|nr:LacI family DNA-binding transcriptional regulator [Lentisphaeria bacterium]